MEMTGADEARSGENGGANNPTSGRMIDEARGDTSRYHHLALDNKSRSNPVGASWFLLGKPVYMKTDRLLSQMLVELFPEEYQLDYDGCI
jgi:hypothetical protein